MQFTADGDLGKRAPSPPLLAPVAHPLQSLPGVAKQPASASLSCLPVLLRAQRYHERKMLFQAFLLPQVPLNERGGGPRSSGAARCHTEPHLTEWAGHGRIHTDKGVVPISREVGIIS